MMGFTHILQANEFPNLPLRPKIPENVEPQTQKFPLKRKKSVRMKIPEGLTVEAVRRLMVPALTKACSHNEFNQRRKGLNYIIFRRKGGGIHKFQAASTGDGNLRDPKQLGLPEMLYLFEGDSSSECVVYSLPYYN